MIFLSNMKDWLFIEHEDGSNIRVRRFMDAHKDSGLYPFRIEITWNRNGAFDEMDMVDKFDECLSYVLEKELDALNTSIYQDDKQFIFTWYTKNIRVFGELLNKSLAFFPPLPIQIASTNDAEWNDYKLCTQKLAEL